VASHLSPERAAALRTAARATVSFVLGRPVGRRAGREPRIDLAEYGRAIRAFEDGNVVESAARIERLYRAHPDSRRVLRCRRDVHAAMGNVSEVARMLHALHELDERPGHRDWERRVLGRIAETTPGWLPRVPGPPRPVRPADPTIVLHLVKESLPEVTSGFTLRTQHNLRAARSAGVRPVVVTALGFPRALGVEVVPSPELVDGIPHHRLDLGPYYSLEQPVDRILEDQAWLTASLALRVRPAIIHASSGHRGFEHALVAAALRAHLRRPFVYEVRSFFEATWTAPSIFAEDSEQYHRRHETESRLMRSADHVITIAEAMRDEIVARGVDPDRVTVIPNGVDPDAFTPRPPDPALAQRFGLEGAFTFGYVSNLDHPRENQELLIAATRILLDRGRRVRCLIVGDGRRRAELEAIATRTRVDGPVTFVGQVASSAVADHLALLDAFVVPRAADRAARLVTPLKPYEAMAMARPLLVADLPALSEIAAPGERGLAFVPGDAEALADALERLMDDPGLGNRLGSAARAWVVRERTWAANGPRFREVYRSVLDDWAGRARFAA
jgi:glycosyltransferase involved in cell wall biosynthesis